MSFITSLISVGVSWIFRPLFSLFLYIDGVVYSLVAYSYKVFMLMAQLNFNVVYAWISPLIDRINAIIMVLIMFKLGYSLIQYMINPDKLSDKTIGGTALLKNIAISAALLISYTFIFSVMNELSMLVIGVPKGYEFTTLKEIADVTTNDGAEADSGLISRFIFGKQANSVGDFGMYLATTTLQVFLHGKDNQNSLAESIYAKQLAKSENGDINTFDLTKITDVVSELDKTVEYKFPILSTAMAIYLIWSIIKLSIEIGVRMFKLIVLQIMAPVAIISIIDKGFDAKPWKAFIDTYWKTWVDAFIRVASLFLVTAFISKFWTDRSALFPDIDGFTRYMVLLIVIFAAYRFAQLLPKFIDGIFGHSLSENNSKGFGKTLGAMAGFGIGAVGGLATGIAAKNGVGGILSNTIGGAFGGANSGSKGANVADFFKGQAGNINKRAGVASENAQWKGRGGVAGKWATGAATALGLSGIHNGNIDRQIDAANKGENGFDQREKNINEEIKNAEEELENASKTMASTESASFRYADGTAVEMGDNKADFISRAVSNDTETINADNAVRDLEGAINSGRIKDNYLESSKEQLEKLRQDAALKRREAQTRAETEWKNAEESSGKNAALARKKNAAEEKEKFEKEKKNFVEQKEKQKWGNKK